MKHRGVWILALAAAVLIAAAIYVSTSRHADRPAGVGELLYPALESHLDAVKAIRIKGPGDSTAVTLQRAESGWKVAERSGFPADTGRVRTLLLGVAQARMLEEKTSLAANYPSLGVEDVSGSGATGTGVELEGPAERVSLIVGKSPNGRSTFVRRKGEATSWQVGTSLNVERDPAKWLATDLADIGADRVQSAEIAVAGKHPWTAAKSSRADLSFTVTGKPKAGSSGSTGSADRIASALAGLRLVDVGPAAEAAQKPAATATYRTFDGLVLAIDGYTDGEKRYVRMQPSVDEAAARKFFVAPAKPSGNEIPAKKAEKAPTQPAADKAPAATEPTSKPPAGSTPEDVLTRTRAEAAKLETRVKGWTFEIPSWNYEAIFPGD